MPKNLTRMSTPDLVAQRDLITAQLTHLGGQVRQSGRRDMNPEDRPEFRAQMAAEVIRLSLETGVKVIIKVEDDGEHISFSGDEGYRDIVQTARARVLARMGITGPDPGYSIEPEIQSPD